MISNSIVFATGNKDKVKEAESILGVKVVGTSLEIDEIQSLDPEKVALAKAKAYFSKLKKAVFVEDTSLSFSVLGGLPGPYISDFLKSIGNEGLVKLVSKNRKATAQVTLVYINSKGNENIFVGKVNGFISKEPKGDKGFGWDAIFIPDGNTRTFAEMNLSEKNKYSMRAKALNLFAKWLSSQKS